VIRKIIGFIFAALGEGAGKSSHYADEARRFSERVEYWAVIRRDMFQQQPRDLR